MVSPPLTPADGLLFPGGLRHASKRYSPFAPAVSPFSDTMNPLTAPFPTYFTGAMLALFSSPIISGMHLASDESVAYWVGSWGYLAALIPVLLIAAHAAHSRLGKLGLLPVVFSTIVPAFVGMMIANVHVMRISGISGQLVSSDCTTWVRKQEMQNAWKAAEKLYDGCINSTVTRHGLTMEDGYRLFRIQECTEYAPGPIDAHAKYRAQWDYLMYLEADTQCAGWCTEGRALWTFEKGGRDPCAAAAGAALGDKVKPVVSRMLAYSTLILLLSAIGVGVAGKVLRERGDDWA